jgi:aldose 1-epimerase
MHSLNLQPVERGRVGIAWFGQSSFAIKSSDGGVALADPFFPSARLKGKFAYDRPPEGVFDLAPGVILLTHDHTDHTDPETVARFAAANPGILLLGPAESVAHIGWGRAIAAGETVSARGFTVKALYAKVPKEGLTTHLSYILVTPDGLKVYISGDAQNDLAENAFLIDPVAAERPDIGLITTHPTEGEFPFFESTAALANRARMAFALPAHYGVFARRSYDPFDWQRKFPLYGARPVILPMNGYACFDPATGDVRYGYDAPPARALCERIAWCGEEAYALDNGILHALLSPRWGGSLFKLTDLQKGCELLHTPVNYETYAKRSRAYGISVILPTNRIREGNFHTAKRSCDMAVNSPDGHHCHGMVGQLPWTVEAHGVEAGRPFIEVSFVNEEGGAFFESFPHRFKLTSRYTLDGAVLRHALRCVNLGEEPMPFGVGCHTAFNVPFAMDSRGERVRVLLPAHRRWALDEVPIPTETLATRMSVEDDYRAQGVCAQGQPIRDHYSGEALVVDGETVNGPVLRDGAAGLKLVYQCGPTFRHWMIWNGDGRHGFICAEPMTWAVDAPNPRLPPEATGYRELAPGEAWADALTIEIKKD